MKTLKFILFISIFSALTSISFDSNAQFYSITGTWQSSSGNKFYIEYVKNYNNVTGIRITNMTNSISVVAKMTSATLYQFEYEGAIQYYSIQNNNDIRVISPNGDIAYWKKL